MLEHQVDTVTLRVHLHSVPAQELATAQLSDRAKLQVDVRKLRRLDLSFKVGLGLELGLG